METRLGLIKNEGPTTEKRIFPRFPFTSLTFKSKGLQPEKVYEVKDISYKGMQVGRRDGGHPYLNGAEIQGELHWKGKKLIIFGTVAWAEGHSLGVIFSEDNKLTVDMKEFLSLQNILSGLRPLHSSDLGLEVPANLKYWLKADGPAEIFVWQHMDGELARFQMILMNHFIEWEDGRGIITGNVIRSMDLDTPLTTEDEFTLEIDQEVQKDKVEFAKCVIQELNDDMLPPQAHEFLKRKLGD